MLHCPKKGSSHMAKLNITQAAKAVGISRQTMNEHLKTKNISVDRSNPKKPLIDTSELLRVYGSLQSPDTKPRRQNLHNLTPANDRKNDALQDELDTLRREKFETLQARVDAAEKERDDWKAEAAEWKAQAQELAATNRLLTDQRPPAPVEPSSSSPVAEPDPASVEQPPEPIRPALPENRRLGLGERVAGWFRSGKA